MDLFTTQDHIIELFGNNTQLFVHILRDILIISTQLFINCICGYIYIFFCYLITFCGIDQNLQHENLHNQDFSALLRAIAPPGYPYAG